MRAVCGQLVEKVKLAFDGKIGRVKVLFIA